MGGIWGFRFLKPIVLATLQLRSVTAYHLLRPYHYIHEQPVQCQCIITATCLLCGIQISHLKHQFGRSQVDTISSFQH